MNLRKELTERLGKGHLSYSSLKYALGDMRLWEMYMRGELKKESEALTFGTLYDMLLFEREKAMDTYIILDQEKVLEMCTDKTKKSKNPYLTNDYKSAKATLIEEAESNGKTLCSAEHWQQANDMIERLVSCGLIGKRLQGKYQVEFNEDVDGIPLKGFLDCLNDDCIVDSKSTRSMSKFKYDVSNFSYDIQAYIYTKVFGIKDFYWLVQEKTYPYYPADVKCSDETLFSGEMKFDQAVQNIKNWLKKKEDFDSNYAEFIV
jgi:hypothetical protein